MSMTDDSKSRGSKRSTASSSSSAPRQSKRQKDKRDSYVDPNANEWDLEWTYPDSDDATFFYMSAPCIEGSTKIASYDYDWTIGVPASGAKFANGRKDWKWWDKSVPAKLKALHGDGFKIVFFTNQAGIEKNKVNPAALQGKFIDIAKELGFPIQVFVSGATNHHRKPNTTMWDHMVEHCNGGKQPDMTESFYCGDAAGRKKAWAAGKKRDFSVSDRKFAKNVGVPFLTPEQHFLGKKPTDMWEWRSVNPRVMNEEKYGDVEIPESIASKEKEVVLMCGFPASGKSTFARRHFVSKGYKWVNRDTLKTPAKCIKATAEALKSGTSVVVDNTNPDRASRKKYIDVAKKAGVKSRCVWLQTPREIAEHMNFCREKQTNGAVRRIPQVGFNMFNKKFEAPQKVEGFADVLKLKFKPHFDSENDRKLFLMWT